MVVKMKEKRDDPSGELVIRTVAMPLNTNANGTIFGGWIMSQMDIGGGILAKEIVCSKVVTAAVNDIVFINPIYVGDIVCCYATCINTGTTSISINIEVWVKHVTPEGVNKRHFVTEAIFVYVAINNENKPYKFRT